MPAVLYVDDEPAIRRAVQLWLARYGVTVLTASGVREACAILAEQPVDGVFIDVWLEDGTGMELYDWLRAERPALARCVAFVTGDTASPAARQRLAATGCPVLPKPFDLDVVKNLTAAWTRAAGGGGPEARREARE